MFTVIISDLNTNNNIKKKDQSKKQTEKNKSSVMVCVLTQNKSSFLKKKIKNVMKVHVVEK